MPDGTHVLVPRINTNDDEAVIVAWHVLTGSYVEAGQLLVTLETTKAAFDVSAPEAGYVFFDMPALVSVDVGAPIAMISSAAAPPQQESPGAAEAPSAEERISRKALRLMRQHALTPADFAGDERIEVADVEELIAARSLAAALNASTPPGTASASASLGQLPSKMIEATTLERVHRSVVPSTVAVSVNEARLQARLRNVGAAHGPVSVLELAIHETAAVLADFPELNGYYLNGRAFSYQSVAIGFAINAGRSLKIPIIHNSNTATQLQIMRAVRDLSLRYMRDELTVEDLTGGTFTVTDLSGYGVVQFVPVVNDRQSAMLGICAERPGTASRDVLLTFDHRMSDGMQAASFLGQLRARLEG